MNDKIKKLLDDLQVQKKGYDAILDVHRDGSELTAEEKASLDGFHSKAMAIQAELQAAREAESKNDDMGKVSDFLSKPQYRVDRPMNDDKDGVKALVAAGWESKGGTLYAPTSLGIHVPLYKEEVIFGAIPQEDPDAAEFFRKSRAIFQPRYRETFAKWLLLSAKYRDPVAGLMQMSGDEQKALSEGVDTAGGYLVPPDIMAELLVRVAQRSVVRRYANIQQTSRDTLRWMRVQPNSTNGSIYSSGFVGDWAGETPAFTDVDPAFGLFDIAVKKLRVATKLSNDFIADSVVDVLGFLAKNGAENMALTEDKGFISGDGTALQPRGILNSGLGTVDVEGSTANSISNTTSNAGSAPKLLDLVFALPSQYAEGPGAGWLLRRSVEGKIRKLVDAYGRYMWPMMDLAFGPPAGRGPRTLLEYPVLGNSDWMPVDDTDANKVLVFGDLSQYIIAQRAMVTVTVLRERFADTDQTGIILWERVGGALWNTDALRIGVV